MTLVDCDVEAPNDHLFLPVSDARFQPVETLVATVDSARCIGCGACRDACAYGAVRLLGGTAMVFDELCHGCGACSDACWYRAIVEQPKRVGEVEAGRSVAFPLLRLVTGRLDIGQVKAPAVIKAARAEAARLDDGEGPGGATLTILDAPPGVACSAVAAVRGADVLLLVTEPTPFGLHDLELSLQLGRDLGIPMGVIVNRGDGDSNAVEDLCARWSVPVLARIPFERRIAEVYARGGIVAQEVPSVAETLAVIPDAAQRLVRPEVRLT